MRLAAIFLSALIAASTGNAQTWNNDKISIGGWNGGAYSAGSNVFSHCAIYSGYRSGLDLFFFVDNKYEWSMGRAGEALGLREGQVIEVVYFIDSFSPQYSKATVTRKKLAVIELPTTSAMFDQFRKGNLLNVMTGGRSFQFKLDGTNAALTEVLNCVSRNLKETSVSKTRESTQSNVISAEARVEAVKFVGNVLAGSGFQQYRILTSSELQKKDVPDELRSAAVAWVGPDTISLLHILPTGTISTGMEVMPHVVASDAKTCKGKFASGSLNMEEGGSVHRFFTACEPENSNSYSIFYSVIRLRDKSHYRIATISFGDAEPARTADEEIKRAAVTLLRN